ncbi:sialate O-acetylesterase [Cyclobacterium jeungdonense]|uniref:Sialate O-acetylesterase n=1 Tax=Cyclobacterium jeungdonense TaxID=708087 RepID=A0ABT8C6W3_9BACT|nr:sialate O-acetylesterase [Cyclobacterium jeungdonense]MDN3688539.1 sialate O-acetylesterase [Cyclobacterium jeungdonense]
MKCFSAITGIFLHLLVLLPIDAPAQKALDLFIWAGQSNAQGWMGDAASYPEQGQELDESILLNWTFVDNQSSGGNWVKMQPQEGRFPKGHFGPEARFGRELKKAGYNPAIFKYTKGATGLARDWKSPGDGGIYDRMTEDLKSAIKLLEEENFKVNVRGFIWIQGETDAGNENTAKEYHANLREMINDLRRNVINEPNLKIILGVDEQHPFVKERPVVVEAQKKLAAEDSTIAFTSMKGLSKADATHLTPEGLVAHGKRIFDAYLSLLTENEKMQLTAFPGEKTDWNGFVRYTFRFEGRDAHVTLPEKALRGNPWVWRARFPGWHTEMDSLLLSEGFHEAFINTNNMYGSPAAVAVWDRFYNYLTTEWKLHPKVALEGVSRGGLFIYNWAKRNPEKVSCIYAEAPVCDFKSWPAGFGGGRASEPDWEQLKKEYGFSSDEEARAYRNNPIDNLEALALAKVPVLHMIGLHDEVVPPQENTYVLIDRYIKLGGPATVIPCTVGKQDLFGHHFPIETPRQGADFIRYHTELPDQLLHSENYHNPRHGIRNSLIKFQKEKRGRVAFLGGSITYNSGWRDSISNYLQERFPDTEFEFIEAGIPSMGSTPAAFRLERDVLAGGSVDLLFLEAAVNDPSNGRSSQEQVRAMEGIVRHVRRNNSATDIVIMHFVDPQKIEDYRLGQVPEVIQNHEKVAAHYRVATINLAKEVTERIDAGEFSWKGDFKNLHPSPFGQGVYFGSIKTFLEKAWAGTVAEEDKIEGYVLPEPIDSANYDNGALIGSQEALILCGWKMVENWKPEDGKGTRTNYVDVPMLIGQHIGDILEFTFNGNAVGIAVAAGPDAGIIEYKIDNNDWQTQDLFTRWSFNLHLPWYYTLAAGLVEGEHVLHIRIAGEKNPQSSGNVCRIRYFFVN